MTEKTYSALDCFRMLCAFFVIAIHTGMFVSFSETADFFVTGVFCRVAVPFFFMVSGFFLMPKIAHRFGAILKIEKKFCLLYLGAIFLYLPLNLYAGQYFFRDVPSFFRAVILDGTFYHLWYFPAVIEGILVLSILQCFLSKKGCFFACLFLYLIGLFGDSYYGISEKCSILNAFYETYFQIGSYTRNGFFFAPVFLCLGWMISDRKYRISQNKAKILCAVSFFLLIAEAGILYSFHLQRHDSMYFFLLPCMYGLFCILFVPSKTVSQETALLFRKLSMIIYLIHPWVIVLVRMISHLLHIERWLLDQSLIHYGAVACISYSLAVILWKIQENIQKKKKRRKKYFVPGVKSI